MQVFSALRPLKTVLINNHLADQKYGQDFIVSQLIDQIWMGKIQQNTVLEGKRISG